jgi:hypothetical protein
MWKGKFTQRKVCFGVRDTTWKLSWRKSIMMRRSSGNKEGVKGGSGKGMQTQLSSTNLLMEGEEKPRSIHWSLIRG